MFRFFLTFPYVFFILTVVILLPSCKDKGDNNEKLNRAAVELQDNPQKAKELLEAIPDSDNLPETESMYYQLLCIEAKNRTTDGIKHDSVILQIRDYYTKQGDLKKEASAHFYAASYHYQNKQYGKAMESFLMANEKAVKSGNAVLEGKAQNNIGYIFCMQGMSDSAIVHFNKALDLFSDNPSLRKEKLKVLNSLGFSYLKMENYDLALDYYKRGLALAQEQGNSSQIAEFSHNIGSTYSDMGELAEAKKYLFEALPITKNKADSVRLYLNLMVVYSKSNYLDSVSYYSGLIEKDITSVTYKPTLKAIYIWLTNYYMQIGDYNEAMRYMELRSQINEEILQEQNATQLLEANAKFILSQRKETLAWQKMWIYILGGFLLVVSLFILLGFRNKRQQLRLELLQKRKKELMLENDLLHQRSVNLSTTLNTYEDILKSRKEMLDDATFEGIEKKKLEAVFDKIRKSANDSFVEWSKNNLKSHPCYKKIILSLSSEELRIMHLLFLEYPFEVVAEMLGFKYDEEDMDYRVRTIKNKLLSAGMKGKEVDDMFKIDESDSKIIIP